MMAIVTAVFLSSIVFAYIMFSGSVSDDSELTYAAVFAVILISLNAVLLAVAVRESRRAKRLATTKRCASCGSEMDRMSTECPGCRKVQVDDDTYLDPKVQDTDTKIRPKK
jgi:hypothetical protein